MAARNIIYWCVLFITAVALGLISSWRASWLSDANFFLKEFVGTSILSIMAIIITVTLASAANVHLRLNDLTEKTNIVFTHSRRALYRSTLSLIFSFALVVVLVVVKSVFVGVCFYEAVFNSLALLVLLFDIFVLLDISVTVFKIPSVYELEKK